MKSIYVFTYIFFFFYFLYNFFFFNRPPKKKQQNIKNILVPVHIYSIFCYVRLLFPLALLCVSLFSYYDCYFLFLCVKIEEHLERMCGIYGEQGAYTENEQVLGINGVR